MRINAPADYSINHFRFVRQLSENSPIEAYEPSGKLRWAVWLAIGALALLAMVIT